MAAYITVGATLIAIPQSFAKSKFEVKAQPFTLENIVSIALIKVAVIRKNPC